MILAVGLFALGLVLLALGGDSIVKGASGLAQGLGLTPFVTGLDAPVPSPSWSLQRLHVRVAVSCASTPDLVLPWTSQSSSSASAF